jgi:cleavage and polyadenylation specificity factor subunit 2
MTDRFRLAPTLSLVLLSHSPTNYLSLYPYARARWGLSCPVYATQPTVEMGRVVCLAEAESWRSEHPVLDETAVTQANGNALDHDMEADEQTTDDKGKTPLRGPFVPTVEEIHEAFDWIKPIRYNQPLHLGGMCLTSCLDYDLSDGSQEICRIYCSLPSRRDIRSAGRCLRSAHPHPEPRSTPSA